MILSTRPARAWALSFAALGCAAGLATAPVATAQLPPGMTPEDVRAVVSAPITVPAGETVTVDVGVPVSASYAGDGWNVTSGGTSVTVTAPDTPGAQVSVPMSAVGQSATITLIAEADAAAAAPVPGVDVTTGDAGANATAPAGPGPASGGARDASPRGGAAAEGGTEPGSPKPAGADEATGGSDAGADTDAAPGAGATAPTPERKQAESVDSTDTRYVDLAAVIDGRSITAQLGLAQAADLYREFQGLDQDSVTLRYLDVNGQIIEGIDREVDMASRSLTLTYPEGQTPDNPFILQIVRDGAAVLVVRLVDENRPVARASEPADVPSEFDEPTTVEASSENPVPAVAVILGLVALVAIVAVVAAVAVRSRRRRGSE